MSDHTGLVHPTPLVRPYVPPAQPDPGPLPDIVEPHPTGMVLLIDPHTRVDVTPNIGHTGQTGLTVTRGESSVTIALPAPSVDALREALANATPLPHPTAPPSQAGGGRW